MKKTLLTIFVTLIAVAGIILISHAIWGEGECIFADDDDDKTECASEKKDDCCDKKEAKKECCDKADHKSHAMMMEGLMPARTEFDAMLSDEEKATIAALREKFSEFEHKDLCPEGEGKMMEEYKDDFDALRTIAGNHKEYFDGLYAEMHKKHDQGCKEGKETGTAEADAAKAAADGCPEVSKCKEATEKCKGEKTVAAEEKCKEEVEKKCKDAESKCKESKEKCQEQCMDTFKIHFLLLEIE